MEFFENIAIAIAIVFFCIATNPVGKLVGIFISDVAAVTRDPKKVEDSRVGVQGSCNRVKDFWDFGFGSAGKKGSSRIRKNFDRHKLVEFAYCKV